MKKYLDPKADLTFKKIFGEHKDLLDNPATCKALENVEEPAMTQDELEAYEDFWDKLGAERLLFVDSNSRSKEEGRVEGRAEGRKEGLAEGLAAG